MNHKNLKYFKLKIILLILTAFIFYNASKSGPKRRWLQWRGPKRDNISDETGLLKKWPDKGPGLLWKASGCGKGYSSVVISENKIFTAGSIDNKTYLLAFDLKGKLKWKVPNGKKWEASERMRHAKNYDGSRATPTINDGYLYHLNELGRLTAFNPESGKEIWTRNIPEEFDAELPKYGYSESVLIDGNRLICYPGGSKGYMVALNKKTGKTIWANKKIDDDAGYCSPILVEDNGIRQIITMSETAVLGVEAETGELLWRYEHINKRKLNISTPVYNNGLVCASIGYGGGTVILKLTYKGKKISVELVKKHKYFDNHHGGIILLNNFVYGTGHYKKGWYCLELKTGKEMYREKNNDKGSFTYADGMFYFFDKKGIIKLIKPSSKKFNVVSQFKLPENGAGPHWAHPVVNNGRLYIRYDDNLYAYDIRKK